MDTVLHFCTLSYSQSKEKGLVGLSMNVPKPIVKSVVMLPMVFAVEGEYIHAERTSERIGSPIPASQQG